MGSADESSNTKAKTVSWEPLFLSSLGISINKRGEEQVRIVLRLLYLIRQVHFTFVCSLSNCLDQVHHPDYH